MAIAFLDDINLNDNQAENLVIQRIGTLPTGVEAKIVYDNGSNTIKYYNGTGWIELDGSGGLAGSGTVGTIPVFVTNTTTLGNSDLTVSGTTLDIAYPTTSLKTLRVQGDLKDINDQTGTAGQLLSSLGGSGNGVDWIDAPVSYTKWIADGVNNTPQNVNDGDIYRINESTTNPGVTGFSTTKAGTTIAQPIGLLTKNMSSSSPSDYATDVLLWGPDTSATGHKVNKTKFTDVTISTWAEAEADLALGGFKIADVGAPTAGGDATNKTYVDNLVVGNLIFQGGYNASTNTPDLDSSPSANIKKGWSYVVTVAGNFFTEAVEVGDFLIAQQDAPTLLSEWVTVQNNVGLATASTVGIGNVNVDGAGDLDGLGLSYSSGTATVGVDIKNNPSTFTAIGEMLFLVYDSGDTGNNLALPIEAVASYVGTANSFAGNNASSGTSHTFTHNLGTSDVIVQLYDTSTKETVYATVDRTGINTVVVTTASSIAAGAIRALITK